RGRIGGGPGLARCRVGHLAGRLKAVLGQQPEVVALVEDLDADVRVELAQAPDLAVLLGHQPLVERGDLDVEPEGGQVEVGAEVLRRLPGGVPLDREGGRLVLPLDPVEVEQPGELPLGVVREGDLVGRPSRSRAGGHGRVRLGSPAVLRAAGAPGGASPGRWARSPSVSAQTRPTAIPNTAWPLERTSTTSSPEWQA